MLRTTFMAQIRMNWVGRWTGRPPGHGDHAVLHGCRRASSVPAEFRQFVQEEHPVVGFADLPGRVVAPPRSWPPPRWCGGGAEGPFDQQPGFRDDPGAGMDAGDFRASSKVMSGGWWAGSGRAGVCRSRGPIISTLCPPLAAISRPAWPPSAPPRRRNPPREPGCR